ARRSSRSRIVSRPSRAWTGWWCSTRGASPSRERTTNCCVWAESTRSCGGTSPADSWRRTWYWRSRPSRRLLEPLPEAVPDRFVGSLQLRCGERELRRPEDVAGFPHESERVLEPVRLELGGARLLEGGQIRAVALQAVVD